MSAEMGAAVVERDVVCPFCAIACDDLAIAQDDDGLRVVEGHCPIAAAAFARPGGDPTPRVRGRPVELPEALDRAALLLRQARLPLLGGLGLDTDGMRAAVRLAERAGGVLDHAHGDGLSANLLPMQAEGWVTGTLAELRSRADLVVLFGTDTLAIAPRFLERWVRPKPELGASDGRRAIVVIGRDADAIAVAAATGATVDRVACEPDRLHEAIGALGAILAGRPPRAREVAGVALEVWQALADRLRDARFAALVWAAADLPGEHRDLTVGGLAALTRTLNATTRCVGIPLAAASNVVGANQVCAWQTGTTLPCSLAAGVPASEPRLWRGARLLADGRADLLVWLCSFDWLEPPVHDLPVVALGPAWAEPSPVPDVFIPVGTPGVDHAGSLYRGDGVVAVPLRRLRTGSLLSAADVLRALVERLPPRDA